MRKGLCQERDAFKAIRWSLIFGHLPHRSFPRSPGKHTQQQRSYPERPAGSRPLFLPVCNFRGARARLALPADPGGAQ